MTDEKFILKNGTEIRIAHASPDDALAAIDFMKSVYGETDFLTGYSDEVRITLEQEENWIRRYDKKTSAMFLAWDKEKLIGNVSVDLLGNKDKVKHRCGLGITISQSYWHQGLGRKLMNHAIEFAKTAGYEQIELEVVAKNQRAIALYLSCGFEIYGTRPRAFKLRDGTYFNEYLMVLQIR